MDCSALFEPGKDVPFLDVVVGVFVNPRNGLILLAKRPLGKPYSGWWELPGGKIEQGETSERALSREVEEELGIRSIYSVPWLLRKHAYPDKNVRLFFRKVLSWEGDPVPCEGQLLQWVQSDRIEELEPLLPAMRPVIPWLSLPPRYAISCANSLGISRFFSLLEGALEKSECPILQLREPGMSSVQFERFFYKVLELCRAYDTILLINSVHPKSYFSACDGVHFRFSDATSELCSILPRKSEDRDLEKSKKFFYGISCHTASDIALAGALGFDYACLSPLLPTESHPERVSIGWQSWGNIALNSNIPVYGLGGLGPEDISRVCSLGGHGVAMMRAAWKTASDQ